MTRILHIEDDPANRLLVRKLLQNAGYEVIDAADGLEGVRLALAEPPDLVLVDLNIPGLDGFEVALRLRGEPSLAGVPIVAITAEGDRETSLAVGCDGFLQKPIDARSFSKVIERYLKGAREVAPAGAKSARLMEQSQRIVAHLEEKVAELSRANARLRELDAARTEFYRNISHELATPMTPIVGYVKLLKDEELGPLSKAQQKALRAMDDCVRRLRSLIDNLIDVMGLETGRMRFIHVEYDFLDTTRRALAAVADRFDDAKITLVEELPRGPLSGWGDAGRLQRAMLQLLENAAKFTPSGGHRGRARLAAPLGPLRALRGRQRARGEAGPPAAHLRALLPGRRLGDPRARRRGRGAGHRPAHGARPGRRRAGGVALPRDHRGRRAARRGLLPDGGSARAGGSRSARVV
jgi:signal transduction histidine kinase